MMLLWLLVAFNVDSPAFCFNADDEKVTPDSGNHIGQTSYFSQISESHPPTCKQEGDCEGTIESGRSRHCWGYEPGCTTPDKWFTKPQCNDEEHWRRFRSKEEKIYEFWKESDFGYVKSVQDNLQVVCKSKEDQADSSSLVCSKQLTYCKAENLYIDLRDNTPPPNHSSQPDVFKPSKIGGYCDVDNSSLDENGKHRMDLSSWLNQVEGFSSLPFHPIRDRHCDVVVDKPTFFMKLDAVVNMYHHFCDFFNLYATQHVNGSFDTDVNIVLWEKHARRGLGNFGATWEAFTTNRVLYLGHEYNNQRVCFRHAIFALLPRMVYGLYYNTPLIRGCSKSGLFKAFSDHLINRLGVKQEKNLKNSNEPIRITLLSRGTKFRKILNEEEIIHALSTYPGVELNVSTYSWDMPFIEQVKRSHNSDIFIGMHGAGLTHTLFLPDWALLFELYNCDDPNCYRDLARLRGVSYMTWENKDKVVEHTEELHPKYSDHSKFRNYAFEVREFMRLVEQAVDTVRQSIKEKNKQEYNG